MSEDRARLSPAPVGEGIPGVRRVCCLLHSLVPGGSGRQWIHLLGCHVAAGGEATIIAPPGGLEGPARAAGIEVITHLWDDRTPDGCERLWPVVKRHEVAIVHWDHRVMRAFEPALAACGRAALAVHQSPDALARWFGPEILSEIRLPLASAVAGQGATVLVRGEWHRRRVATAFDLHERDLRILPASIPMPSEPPPLAIGPPRRMLALMRLSPDKAAIAQLAVELVRFCRARGEDCRLAIAGEGPWREQAVALCERRLPAGSWDLEGAPLDPIARLSDSDLVVAQGLTTLEAATLGRRVVVARSIDADRAAGTVLRPDRYGVAARDPFGRPPLSEDAATLWEEIAAVDSDELSELRELVRRHNSIGVASRALGTALAETAAAPDAPGSPRPNA